MSLNYEPSSEPIHISGFGEGPSEARVHLEERQADILLQERLQPRLYRGTSLLRNRHPP